MALDGWAYPRRRNPAGEAAMECVATAPRIPFPYTDSPARNGKLWLLWYLSGVYLYTCIPVRLVGEQDGCVDIDELFG
jgi:hypothetical protein